MDDRDLIALAKKEISSLGLLAAGDLTDGHVVRELNAYPVYDAAYRRHVDTLREYLTKTMRLNFDWFEKYPHYVFNFSGANRYRMMKEYFPADYAKLKQERSKLDSVLAAHERLPN